MILATVPAQTCSRGRTLMTSPVMFKTGTDDTAVLWEVQPATRAGVVLVWGTVVVCVASSVKTPLSSSENVSSVVENEWYPLEQ